MGWVGCEFDGLGCAGLIKMDPCPCLLPSPEKVGVKLCANSCQFYSTFMHFTQWNCRLYSACFFRTTMQIQLVNRKFGKGNHSSGSIALTGTASENRIVALKWGT